VLIYGLDGSCLKNHRCYTDGLGIKSVAWAPNGQLLALGSYDQVRLTGLQDLLSGWPAELSGALDG
jgi:WD40 repeat protein